MLECCPLVGTAEQSPANRRLAQFVVATLLDNKIPTGIFSGTHAALIGGHRVSQDVDLWVPTPAIEKVASLFPKAEVLRADDRTIVTLRTKGGAEAEIMANMTIHTPDGAVPFHMTPAAQSRLTLDPTWGVKRVDQVDTLLLKALLQRGTAEEKHDWCDARVLAQNIDNTYLWFRLGETGAFRRALPFLAEVGVIAIGQLPELLPDQRAIALAA